VDRVRRLEPAFRRKRQFGAVLARHCGRMVAVGHGSNFYVYAYAQS
jgi:hypothetical protein